MRSFLPSIKIGMVLAALAMGASTSSAAAPQYRLVDLGLPDGAVGGGATAINDNGQVVGDAYDWTRRGAFVWQNGTMQSLPNLSGYTVTSAHGINSSGIVVGSQMSPGFRAVQWSNGTIRDLNALPGGQFLLGAGGINDSGLMVGNSWGPADRFMVPVLIKPDGVVGLTRLSGDTSDGFAIAINNAGVSVGYDDSNAKAMMWIGQTPVVLGSGVARAVNELNTAAGVERTGFFAYDPGIHAALWRYGEAAERLPIPSGFVGSYAYGINDANWVVGKVSIDQFDPFGNSMGWGHSPSAVLWQNGVVHRLDDLVQNAEEWIFAVARDINNHNQIVGTGFYRGQERPFMLLPVPEPSALVMLLAGIGLIGGASIRCSHVRRMVRADPTTPSIEVLSVPRRDSSAATNA